MSKQWTVQEGSRAVLNRMERPAISSNKMTEQHAGRAEEELKEEEQLYSLETRLSYLSDLMESFDRAAVYFFPA